MHIYYYHILSGFIIGTLIGKPLIGFIIKQIYLMWYAWAAFRVGPIRYIVMNVKDWQATRRWKKTGNYYID